MTLSTQCGSVAHDQLLPVYYLLLYKDDCGWYCLPRRDHTKLVCSVTMHSELTHVLSITLGSGCLEKEAQCTNV